MNYDNTAAAQVIIDTGAKLDQNKIRYLDDRMYQVNCEKIIDLRRHFGYADDDAPMTKEDFVERVKNGKFEWPEDEEFSEFSNPLYNLRWKDADKKKDITGLTKARERLSAKYDHFRDIIKVCSPEVGLKALREFQDLDVKTLYTH